MISFIIPTLGRPTLWRAIDSIETEPGDEIIVVGKVDSGHSRSAIFIKCATGNDWGAKERKVGIARARGKYLAFMDDDDIYLPGHRAIMSEVVEEFPDRPILFRMRYPNGRVLWNEPALRCGNVSSQMMLVPNVPAKLGVWSSRREGDFDFLSTLGWEEIIFRPEIVAELGHNDG